MKCRATSIVTPCDYSRQGISNIRLIDLEDFEGLRFERDARYDTNLITAVLHTGAPISIDTPNSARYVMSMDRGTYTHSIETFVKELGAYFTKNLHLATKRRYIILFDTQGKTFLFGYKQGASLSYTNQTEGATGSMVTLSITSKYPLFEVSQDMKNYTGVYDVDYDSAICENNIHEINEYFCENE